MKILPNAPLVNFTSLHAGGPAEVLVQLDKDDDLYGALKSGQFKQPFWVLGYGTNILVSDKGLPGTVFVNHAGGIEKTDNKYKVSAGVDWDDFIRRLISDGMWGLEFTSGIPGGTGAALAGNIAAYGQKVADRFVEASLLNSQTGELELWDSAKMAFDYRASSLQMASNRHLVVLNISFELSGQPTGELEYESALNAARDLGVTPDSLDNRRKIIMETRKRAGSLLPNISAGPFTAGSFFKNPVVTPQQLDEVVTFEEVPGKTKAQILEQNKIHGQSTARVSAALVLLAAGFQRGQSWGNVRLHPSSILKIENAGQATAQEIYDVAQNIMLTVRNRLGIELEPEVRFLGDFEKV